MTYEEMAIKVMRLEENDGSGEELYDELIDKGWDEGDARDFLRLCRDATFGELDGKLPHDEDVGDFLHYIALYFLA